MDNLFRNMDVDRGAPIEEISIMKISRKAESITGDDPQSTYNARVAFLDETPLRVKHHQILMRCERDVKRDLRVSFEAIGRSIRINKQGEVGLFGSSTTPGSEEDRDPGSE